MYENIFGLTARPFTSTPFIQNYFAGESIHHALAQTRMCIERASGPVIVTGSSGTGKSLLLAMLADNFKNDFTIINVVCSNQNERKDLLQNVLFELRLPYKDMTEGELRLSLIDHLKNNRQDAKRILMLVDEAQGLSFDLLDELRSITNLVCDGEPCISLVLAGTSALEDHLIETKSESFNQRIAARCYLTHLSQNETIEYVLTHIERAGGNGELLFTGDALTSIYKFSDGCPRIINQISDYALVLAASQNLERVNVEIAQCAWNDVQSIPGTNSTVTSEYSTDSSDPQESDDEDLMVIEFGQLEDEEPSSAIAGTIAENGQLTDNDFPYNSVVEENFNQNDANLNVINSESNETTAPSAAVTNELKDFDYSITEDSYVSDSGPNFDNPFDERFAEEENVAATYYPTVSEQNLNALMLDPQHLHLLEAMTATQCATTHETTPTIANSETQLDSVTTQNNKTNTHDELRLSTQGLASLEKVEEDIKQLQRDLRFSERQFSSEAVHPNYSLPVDNQPLEELLQNHAVVEAINQTNEIAPMPLDNNIDDNVDTGGPETIAPESMDDRDMMVIGQPKYQRHTVEIDDEEFEGAHRRISTGHAKRMDYVELFQQLRSTD